MTDPQIDVEAYRQKLLSAKAELEALSESARDAAKAVELDQTKLGRLSRMDALRSQAMAQETKRRRQAELTKIAAALVRIEEGEYGYCMVCGEPIPKARLDLDPAVATCVDHAA